MIKGLKICGVSDSKTLDFIINHPNPPEFIGFITNYKKSKRFVHYEKLKELTKFKKNKVKFTSVLVDPDNYILEKIKNLNFDYYQLYDVEPQKTKEIKIKYKVKIITAITVSGKNDVLKYKDYNEIADIILFDSKGYHKSESFDHSLLDIIPDELNKMIAGNIQIDDIYNFENKKFYIDLSGALENEEGKKDINKINRLLNLFGRT